MFVMRRLCILCLAWLITAGFTFAQSDSGVFGVSLQGPLDTEPPTTPTLTSVESITSSQINVVWSASTDNVFLEGYVVLRDGSEIATTTLLTYSDVGLSPSTSYSYFVKAFDSSSNFSSSSNSLSTSTPEEVFVDVSSKPSSGTASRVVLEDLIVGIGVSTTSFDIKTTFPSRIEMRWGRSDAYELGYIVGGVFTREHVMQLAELEPGTKYEYEIVGYTPFGISRVLKTGVFTTESPRQAISPVNVYNFYGVSDGNDVLLAWDLPKDENILSVRLVRSHFGFPDHPNAGAIVYQGDGGSTRDAGALRDYSPVYYTAFVYDKSGNVSSGAVAMVYSQSEFINEGFGDVEEFGQSPDTEPSGGNFEEGKITEEATSSVVAKRVTPEMKMPNLSDIIIIQGENEYLMDQQDIILNYSQHFVIRIPKEVIAGNLKSIIATVYDPVDNRRSGRYLLRLNKDGLVYEAAVAGAGVLGQSKVEVQIYDYEAFIVASYSTPVSFVDLESTAEVVFPDKIYKSYDWLLQILFVVGLILLVMVMRLKTKTQ